MDAVDKSTLPLSGIKVIEAGVLLAGPFCGQLLADFGAEVIKIEPPGRGDPMRVWGQAETKGHSLWFSIVARGKKSVELDLRVPAAQELFRKLAQEADIVVENFRPGTLEGWGIGYEQLKAINPRIIMVRVSGYGQDGPYAKHAGYASVGEAIGGLRHVIGYPDRPPSRAGISIGDTLAGMFGTIGALVALHDRTRSGLGQFVDSAIYEAVLACMESLIPDYVLGGQIRERTGSSLKNVAPSNVYPASDGDIIIAANQDTVFRRLSKTIGHPEWSDDPRFADHYARGRNHEELDALIGAWSVQHTTADLIETLEKNGVPAGKIYRAPDMMDDPHFKARNAIIKLMHPALGAFPMQNVFPKLSRTPGEARWVGPMLGEHNQEILAERLGLSPAEIAAAQNKPNTPPKQASDTSLAAASNN